MLKTILQLLSRIVTTQRYTDTESVELNLQIPTGAQRDDSHRRWLALSVLTNVIKTWQRPANRPIPTTNQDLEVWDVTEHIQPAMADTPNNPWYWQKTMTKVIWQEVKLLIYTQQVAAENWCFSCNLQLHVLDSSSTSNLPFSLSPQIWNKNRVQLPPPVLGFPLHFRLLSPVERKFC